LQEEHFNKSQRPFHRYMHKGSNTEENEAWRWFVEMQLTGLETQELRTIENKRQQLGYASTMQHRRPEDEAADRVLYDRHIALLEAAELRAEEILEQHTPCWQSWLDYFGTIVLPEMNKSVHGEIRKDGELDCLTDFKLRFMDAFKDSQREESRPG